MKKIVMLSGVVVLLFLSAVHAAEYGMYVKAVEKVGGTFEEAVKSTEEAFSGNGWQVLTSYEAAVPEACGFRAHTVVVHWPEYTEKILARGPRASFALPVRVAVYEDEKGINVAFVNPSSLNRTVVGDGVIDDISVKSMNFLSELIAGAVKGTVVNQQIGEVRSKGRVGGMGGGNFNDKIEIIFKKEDTSSSFTDTVQKVKDGIVSNSLGWKLVYALNLGKANVVILGVNSPSMEARAFKIAGEKREGRNYRCPGIDHAAAFPIEVVVFKEKGMVKVGLLDGMYRMKVYFEDAGNWAFMKNMGMPGEIQDDIVSISTAKLK